MSNKEKSAEDLINEIKQTDEIKNFIERNDDEFLSKPLHEKICNFYVLFTIEFSKNDPAFSMTSLLLYFQVTS